MTSEDWPLVEFEYKQEQEQCLKPVDRHIETGSPWGESHPPGESGCLQ